MWGLAPTTAGGLDVLEVGWRSVVSPLSVFEELATSNRSAFFGWWYALGYAALYSGTAALLAGRGFVPTTKPLLPIPERDFYAWQTLFTIPAGVGATGLGCLAAYGIAQLFGSEAGLSELWGPFAVAMVVPTFLTMWVVETVGPFVARRGSTTDPYPERFNLGRIVLGATWSVILAVVAVTATGLGVFPSILAGVLGAAIVGGMFAILR